MPTEARPRSGKPGGQRHILSESQFDDLAHGAGDDASREVLWQAERSQRLLLLDLFLDLTMSRPAVVGPLDDTARAWELLTEAYRSDKEVIEELLLFPETGLALSHALRRLRGGPAEPSPLWVDIGSLHCIAAAGALSAGLDFAMRLPVRHGTIWLPNLGRALLDRGDAWETADVTFTNGHLTIRDSRDKKVSIGPFPLPSRAASDTWHSPVYLAYGPPEERRSVLLDDLSHHRVIGTSALPRRTRVTDQVTGLWSASLHEAWSILRTADPQSASDVIAFLRSIEPLSATGSREAVSGTSGDGVGRLAVTEPQNPLELASLLAHEVQHSKFSILLHLYSFVYDRDTAAHFYAPWRDDPRPMRGILHGVYAFTAVARLWLGVIRRATASGDERNLLQARFEFALRCHQLRRTLAGLPAERELTPLGHRLVARLSETVDAWHDEPLDADVVSSVRQAADDHALQWRLHHLVPDKGLVTRLAEAWLSGSSQPPEVSRAPASVLRPPPTVPSLDIRLALLRLRLTGSDTWHRISESPQEAAAFVDGSQTADALLVKGEYEKALGGYADEISGAAVPRSGVAAAGAWSGLGWALRVSRPEHPGGRLAALPELAPAVHREVRDRTGRCPDPVDFWNWLMGHSVRPR